MSKFSKFMKQLEEFEACRNRAIENNTTKDFPFSKVNIIFGNFCKSYQNDELSFDEYITLTKKYNQIFDHFDFKKLFDHNR